MGDSASASGTACVLDMTVASAVVGVINDEVESGCACGGPVTEESTRSAGFGNVLYVDPSDVYL